MLPRRQCLVVELKKINKFVFPLSVNTVGCRRPSLNTVDNSNSCFFTETTQFQTTATADFMFTTTTVSPGFRVNWAIHDVLHILVTFPQLLWLSLSLEHLQKFITDSVKGWPCTFLVGCCVPDWKKLGGLALDFQFRTTFRCGRDVGWCS